MALYSLHSSMGGIHYAIFNSRCRNNYNVNRHAYFGRFDRSNALILYRKLLCGCESQKGAFYCSRNQRTPQWTPATLKCVSN